MGSVVQRIRAFAASSLWTSWRWRSRTLPAWLSPTCLCHLRSIRFAWATSHRPRQPARRRRSLARSSTTDRHVRKPRAAWRWRKPRTRRSQLRRARPYAAHASTAWRRPARRARRLELSIATRATALALAWRAQAA